ncbi:lysozyme inhibitor LprI family protein [Mesorhizobium sp. B4-1-3]|uniref:lysozyme inhibitor LprI family protein n=1 Tax=Mesorhizobium sp. B4-1-3 TaxID=2589889 RepID=UPI001FEDCB81|nr:lysozyme inhibitor LprI family protein [Mesorhizobium sp. B4-1-3]
MQTAQRAWISFRDAECAYSTAGSEGGSIHPTEMSECLTKLTNERIKQLTSDANCKLSDRSCAGSDAGDDQDMQ